MLEVIGKRDILRLVDNPSSLPVIEWIDITTLHDDRRAVLVTSPSAETQFGDLAHNFNFSDYRMISDGDAEYIDNLTKNKPDTSVMYAVGGGRVIDIARLLASRWGMDITAIPTIISTDALFVKSTAVRENGCVHYVQSKKADRVFLDWNLLSHSPPALHAGGCVDVLSIYTALHDWRLAHDRQVAQPDEQYLPIVAQQAEGILQYLLGNEADIAMMSRTGLESIVRALAMEVKLCNLYGNSRPEEGAEHFFSYAIEPCLPHTTHGELVGLGILLTANTQKQSWEHIRDFMDRIGMNYHPNGISAPIIIETLNVMRSFVEKHGLRYSVWNEYAYDEENIMDFLKTLKL